MKPIVIIRTCALALVFALSACKPTQPPASSQASTAPPQFEAKNIAVGTGAPIETGQVAVVHYTGWLYDTDASDHHGRKFDSSRDRGMPFKFRIGSGDVIKGWERGVVGMQVGGRRELIIPPDLGYGAEGAGGGVIPPNASLLFEVELLGIQQ